MVADARRDEVGIMVMWLLQFTDLPFLFNAIGHKGLGIGFEVDVHRFTVVQCRDAMVANKLLNMTSLSLVGELLAPSGRCHDIHVVMIDAE